MTARIRPAEAADRQQVTSLVTDADLPLDGLADAWLTLVADDDGRIDAVSALERYASAGGFVYLLRSVAVRADRRGNGLGRLVVRAAVDAADRDSGVPATVGLLTDTADGYFDQFGFRRVDRDELPVALSGSVELQGLCSDVARAYLRS